MKAKGVLKALGKVAIAGLIAFLALTAFCLVYYNLPSHAKSPDGSTDFRWEPKVFYSRATEGFAWGRTNNEGFADAHDLEEGAQVGVLIMGSSQMEGFNVDQKDTAAYLLGEMLGDKTVYNIGVSSHTFCMCCGNLEAALSSYRPQTVVIETNVCVFSDPLLEAVINGTVKEVDSHTEGLLGLLQRNQYLRLLYSQFSNYREKKAADEEEDASSESKLNDPQLLAGVLSKIGSIAEANGAKLVILYHPGTELNPDGSLKLTGSEPAAAQFAELCPQYGIVFLDLSERIMEGYERESKLPYGFANTPVGSGHLNKYGHKMIAEELFKTISEAS